MTSATISAPIEAPMERSTSIRRAFLFLLVCAPTYLAPGIFSVGHPIVMTAGLVAVTYLFLRSERRPLAALGLDPSWQRVRELAGGFAGGALIILAAAACVRLFLPFPWAWNPHFAIGVAVFSLVRFLSGNAVEELVFRGYGFDRLIAGIGHWPAQIVTALPFAVYHVVQGWPWQTALLGTTVGSLLFGLVFVRWRSVPAATGVHAAANWVRDLLLVDPPTAKTLLAPLAPRHWTSTEQVVALAIMDGVFLLASLALAISITRRSTSTAASYRT